MILSKVLSKYQLTLPKEAVKALHIGKGDFLRCEIQSGRLLFTPVVIEESYSAEELKKFDKLYNDPKNRGRRFRSTREAIRYLESL